MPVNYLRNAICQVPSRYFTILSPLTLVQLEFSLGAAKTTEISIDFFEPFPRRRFSFPSAEWGLWTETRVQKMKTSVLFIEN
jgi:hypothetical protein